MFRCPGQDQRFWRAEDIFEVRCSNCNTAVEFFKDEPKLRCPRCLRIIVNPKLDLGCAEWCQYASQCFGTAGGKETGVTKKPVKNKTIKKTD
ncbi:MAG: hypothetical protein ABIG61_17280 [Planctomycetota bacterium]